MHTLCSQCKHACFHAHWDCYCLQWLGGGGWQWRGRGILAAHITLLFLIVFCTVKNPALTIVACKGTEMATIFGDCLGSPLTNVDDTNPASHKTLVNHKLLICSQQ